MPPSKAATVARELMFKRFEQGPFIIGDGLLGQQAILIIGGPPKSYKSFLVNTLISHLTTATPLFSANRSSYIYFNIPKVNRVLLLEQEIGEYDLQQRLLELAATLPRAHQDLLMDNLFIRSCDHDMRLDSTTGRTYMADVIHSVKPDVVIMDPFIEFHDGDENSTREMSHMLHNLDWLRERLHFATVIVHHTAKLTDLNQLRSGPDLLRGSSVLQAKADSFIMVQKMKEDHPAELRAQFTLRRGRPIPKMRLLTGMEDCLFKFHRWESGDDAPVINRIQ